jgi:hypothetical protein
MNDEPNDTTIEALVHWIESLPSENDKKFTGATESSDFVNYVSTKTHGLILSYVLKIHPKQRVLIMGRIINLLFQRHYQALVEKADEANNTDSENT